MSLDLSALPGAPFDLVLDVGGNVGEFAEQAVAAFPSARVVSFEPVPELADANRARAAGRWEVVQVALGDSAGEAILYVCRNQHSASTMMEPGGVRSREFGIVDSYAPICVQLSRLDYFLHLLDGRDRVLVKVDVEGHEGQVIAGGRDVLTLASTVIVECQQDPDIFIGSPSPAEVDRELRRVGLDFAGVAGVLCSPSTRRVLQFDGVWTRAD